MAKKTNDTFVISLRALAAKSEVDYMKLYNNVNGLYASLSHQEKVHIVNTFYDEVTPMLKKLGFYIKIHPIKDPTPVPPR